MQASVATQPSTQPSPQQSPPQPPPPQPQPPQQQQAPQGGKNQSNSNSSSSNSHHGGGARQPLINIDVPVRILVPSESVGAIIGKGGQTIRQLTQQSRAKVDVYRGDLMSNALQEKVITIRGQPDNCINACREILKVMKADSESKGKTNEMPLKVLAHNDYIGRIIGKQGDIINSIKRDTDTTVTVSSVNDMSMNVERVITVKGELENMIKALAIIHAKIRSAFENDSKTYGHQAMVMSSIPPMPMIPPPPSYVQAAGPYAAGSNGHYAKAQAAAHGNYAANPAGQLIAPGVSNAAAQSLNPGAASSGSNYSGYYQPQLIHHLSSHHHNPPAYSPANMAAAPPPSMYGHVAGPSGAPAGGHVPQAYNPHSHAAHGGYLPAQLGHQPLNEYQAGAGGQVNGYAPAEPERVFLYIPNTAVGAIIGSKGSYIKNLIKLSGASIKIAPVPPEESKSVSERQVIISGLPDSQCKAQFYIYEKIRQERYTTDDNVKLRAEIQVPASKIGRIIGRSGKNVRELQRSTGATIKLPEDAVQSQRRKQRNGEEPTGEEAAAEPVASESAAPEPVDEAAAKADESAGEVQVASPPPPPVNSNEYVMVGIIGTYNASQLAQRRIQALINSSAQRSAYEIATPVEGKGHYYPPRSNGYNGRKGQRGGHHYPGAKAGHPFSNRPAREQPEAVASPEAKPPVAAETETA